MTAQARAKIVASRLGLPEAATAVIAQAIHAAVKYERERCVRVARRHGTLGLCVAEEIQAGAREERTVGAA